MHSCTSTGSGMIPSLASCLASHRWPVSKASISIRTPAAVIRARHVAQQAGRVDHHIVGLVEVHRAAVERADLRLALHHMRHPFRRRRPCRTFLRHPVHRLGPVKDHVAAHPGGQVQHHVGGAVADALGHLAVERQIARGLARLGVAHVAMHHRRPGLGRRDGAVGDLLRAARHMRTAVLRAARAGDGTGDEDLAVHGQRHRRLLLFGATLGVLAPRCRAIYEMNMTESATIFGPAQGPLTLAALVLPQASILEVASVLDPLRSANRHLGTEAFRWRVVSPDGAPVPLTCGIELPSTGPLDAAEGADALVVIAGFRQAEVATRPLIRSLRRIAPRFRAVGGIDAGAWVLARAGLLDGHRATVHWEDLEDLAAAHPQIDVAARPLRVVRQPRHRGRRGPGSRPDAAPDRCAPRRGARAAGGGLVHHHAPATGPSRRSAHPRPTRHSTPAWPPPSPGWRRASTRPNPPPPSPARLACRRGGWKGCSARTSPPHPRATRSTCGFRRRGGC